MIKNILNKFAMYLGLFLLFGILLFPNMRDVIGHMVGILLNPLLTILPLHIIIFILAAITGLYASIIQKYTMNWELAKRVQEKMKTIQNEFRQAQLANNTQKMKKIEAQRAEMMGDQMEMMKQQFKPMLYISIISLPLFFWVYIVIRQDTNAMMDFPFWGSHKLTENLIGPIQFWLFWYFICSIPVSQMTRKALNIGGM
jgi:uncharacterized membrane protein (DUF106 family)